MRNQLVSPIWALANDGVPKVWSVKPRNDLPVFAWPQHWTELFGSRAQLRKRVREFNDRAVANSTATSAD